MIGSVPGLTTERADLACGLDDAPLERLVAGRFVAAVENVGVEVDLARPFDGARLRIDADLVEHRAVVADRREHAAPFEHGGEVDVLDEAVGEVQAHPASLERGGLGDAWQCVHGSGSMALSGAGVLASRQLASTSSRCSSSHSRTSRSARSGIEPRITAPSLIVRTASTWWSMMCDWNHRWEVETDGSEPSDDEEKCPEEGHEAVMAARWAPADRVRVVLVPAARATADGYVSAEGRCYIELFDVGGERSLRTDGSMPWDEAARKAQWFADLSWEDAERRWRRTGMV